MPENEIQELIDTGMAWRLEGFVGRQAAAAIEHGAAVLGPVGHFDYWGNYVPSRFEVEPGTKGSVLYFHTLQGHRPLYKNCSPCRRLRQVH